MRGHNNPHKNPMDGPRMVNIFVSIFCGVPLAKSRRTRNQTQCNPLSTAAKHNSEKLQIPAIQPCGNCSSPFASLLGILHHFIRCRLQGPNWKSEGLGKKHLHVLQTNNSFFLDDALLFVHRAVSYGFG